ncbi:BNR repeat-containing protein [Agrococcus sediminis]|uniref:BNR repeat-containing protein n=1 Tax=Agrococcus sediminis TaxID=2599924 RepID=UPI0034323443
MHLDDPALVSVAAFHYASSARFQQVETVGLTVADLYATPASLSHERGQVVAYYAADRELTIAMKPAGVKDWRRVKLDVFVDYDSHADIVLGMDTSGRIHACANMHASPLVYFRSEDEDDPIGSIRRVEKMVDHAREQKMTYPRFFSGHADELWFAFRAGTSGDGDVWLYRWDPEASTWQAGTQTSLVSRAGMSPYLDQYRPLLGPDAMFHMAWVWRDSPEAESNHTLSYARSPDLEHWFAADGAALQLPLGASPSLVVDGALSGEGLLNNNCRLGFTSTGAPLIVYHKYIRPGVLQVHVAVLRRGAWTVSSWSGWEVAWAFEGRGSLDFKLEIGTVTGGQGGVCVSLRGPNGVRIVQITGFDDGISFEEVLRIDEERPGGMRSESAWWSVPDSSSEELALVWQADRPRRDIEPSHARRGRVGPLLLVRRAARIASC